MLLPAYLQVGEFWPHLSPGQRPTIKFLASTKMQKKVSLLEYLGQGIECSGMFVQRLKCPNASLEVVWDLRIQYGL